MNPRDESQKEALPSASNGKDASDNNGSYSGNSLPEHLRDNDHSVVLNPRDLERPRDRQRDERDYRSERTESPRDYRGE